MADTFYICMHIDVHQQLCIVLVHCKYICIYIYIYMCEYAQCCWARFFPEVWCPHPVCGLWVGGVTSATSM